LYRIFVHFILAFIDEADAGAAGGAQKRGIQRCEMSLAYTSEAVENSR
jgi:hypothetical protein